MRAAREDDAGRPALVPVALAAALVGAITLCAVVVPAPMRGPATLAAAAAVLLVGYLRAPKPTLLVFALFMLIHNTFARWLSPSLEQLDEIVVPALVLLSAWRLRPWRGGWIEPVRDGAVIALVLVSVVSSVVNGVPPHVWLLGLFLLLKVLAFLYVVMWHDFTLDDVRRFAPLVLGFGVILLALGVVELADPDGFRQFLNLTTLSEARGQLPSIKSLFWHPVLFAWFTGFVALYLFAYYVVFRRWWLLLAAMAFSLGTMLSARRRTIAGVALGLGAGFLNQLRHSRSRPGDTRPWLPVATGVIVLVLAFQPGMIALYQLTLNETGPGGENEARIALYTKSAEIARDYFPLGAGLGRYGSAVSRIEYSPLYERYGLDQIVGIGAGRASYITDTFWPRILGETGVFGLAAYLVFAGALTFSLWRASGRAAGGDPNLLAFALGTLMVFAEAWVETLASSMFDSPPRIYLLFGAVGVCLVLSRSRRAQPEDLAAGR